MPYALGVIIIVVGLALSIGLHELGHFLPAKRFGVKVSEFFVGFGKKLWSRQRGETEYGLKLIPLGGYVRMHGMYPDQAQQEAEALELEGDDPEAAKAQAAADDKRSFYRLATWKKLTVMFGGPFMNLLLAVVFYAILLVGFGTAQYTTKIGAVNECLVSATSESTECSSADPVAPGAAAGLRAGDVIVSIDGQQISDWTEIQAAFTSSPNDALPVTVERDGVTKSLTVTPMLTERYVLDESGQTQKDSSGAAVTEAVGMVGISPAVENVRQPIAAVLPAVADNVGQVFNMILHLPQRMIDIFNAAFGSEERDANGPISVLGVGRVAGEIASQDTIPVVAKAQAMIGLLASLNVALFVFNLIPLMPLDGGHMLAAIYEAARRQVARVRRKPDPGPVNAARLVPITYVVVAIFGGMSLLLIYADIVKPVNLFG